MLKNILNLEGAQKLTKSEQKLINGGKDGSPPPPPGLDGDCSGWTKPYVICPTGQVCQVTVNPDRSLSGICVLS